MSSKIGVAIIGVGDCAAALVQHVQGVHPYRDAADDDVVPGLLHLTRGGHRSRASEFVAASNKNVDARP